MPYTVDTLVATEYRTVTNTIYSGYILQAQIFANLEKSASEVMFAKYNENIKNLVEIFVNVVLIRKFHKNLDLTHKACYMVLQMITM